MNQKKNPEYSTIYSYGSLPLDNIMPMVSTDVFTNYIMQMRLFGVDNGREGMYNLEELSLGHSSGGI